MDYKLRRWTALLALPLGVLACEKTGGSADKAAPSAEAKADAFGELTVEQVDAKIAEAKAGKVKLYIFDNNPEDAYKEGHLPGAKWVKFNEIKAADLPADKEAMLVFYCASEA